MATDFTFDGSKSFEDNFAAFLDVLDGVDGEMSAILRANMDVLGAIVHDGDRDANARARFNAAIAAALDAPNAPEGEKGES